MQTLDIDHLGTVIDSRRTDLRVVTSGHCSTPLTVLGKVDTLLAEYRLHLLNAPRGIPQRDGVIPESAFVGVGMRHHPRLVYFPMRLSGVPFLYQRRLRVDVVIAHTSAPIAGKVSLGLEINVLPGASAACKAAGGIVIAQVNRQNDGPDLLAVCCCSVHGCSFAIWCVMRWSIACTSSLT